ncbi:MAG TPA: hypothetical protein VIM89_06825 [Mucilaginibacter sp.]
MNNDFCKILIISNSIPNDDNATSITLKNMFSGWPADKVAIIYTSLDKNTPQSQYRTFHISELKFIKNKASDQDGFLKTLRSSKSEVKGVSGAAPNKSLKGNILNYLHTLASSYKALLPYRYDDALNRFISEFKPDVIYSPLGSIAITDITYKLSVQYNLPVVPHFMDDWPHTIYEGDPMLLVPRLKKKRLLNKVLRRTKAGIVISEKMANEYRSEYHKEFFALMNCVDIKEPDKTDQHKNGKIVFSYFGGLHLLRWQTLLSFFKAVKNNRAYAANDLEFRIYTSDADRAKYQHEFGQIAEVVFCDRVSQGALIGEMRKSNYLVHVEAFDEKIKKYTRLSISTKIPEYLVAQRPIIAIGPGDIASIEYLRDNDCAHVIADLNSPELSGIIDNSASEEYNKRLLANGWQLFLKNHEMQTQHDLLKYVFQQSLDKK